MIGRALRRAAREWRGLIFSAWLGGLFCGCDRRFEFDVEPGGAAGMTSSAGSAVGGSARGGDGGSTGIAGEAAQGLGASGSEAGDDGGGGTPSASCGELPECSAGTHCAEGACAQCAVDGDCGPYALPRCEPSRHRCVACVTTADRQPGFACDSLANRCLQTCSDDDFCPPGAHGCDERRSVCYECDEDRECATSPLGRLCATDGSGCVQCRKDSDCPGQHCDQLSGRCVECRDGQDCASRLCDPASFSCVSR